jgi:uncharacterized protein YjbJ (UPF0337 family)
MRKNSVKSNRRRANLDSQGRADTVRGRVNRLIGKLQYQAGQLTGNRKLRARGTALHIKGSWQFGLGRAKQKLHQALNHVRS